MSKAIIKTTNPDQYKEVRAEQAAMRQKCCGGVMLAKLCPYCSHMIELIQRGDHGPSYVKCPKCGEDVIFPPISFRTL